ncbi:unnamed protein product, partial [Anisakis simplex]|uniref:HRDC domain-containing protein n=1 Tax=Anisakis simplex TaxID=6269 RepID=A0A0M3KJM3_ANISI
MPRTNSDLLQIEGMTSRKVERYASRIMEILKKFWLEIDAREQNEIRQQLNHMKQQNEVVGGFAQLPTQPSTSSLATQSGVSIAPSFAVSGRGRFVPRFNSSRRGRGGVSTKSPKKKSSQASYDLIMLYRLFT